MGFNFVNHAEVATPASLDFQQIDHTLPEYSAFSAASNTAAAHGSQASASAVLSNGSWNTDSLSSRVWGADRTVSIRRSTSTGSRSAH